MVSLWALRALYIQAQLQGPTYLFDFPFGTVKHCSDHILNAYSGTVSLISDLL